jgi:hypothetical protein
MFDCAAISSPDSLSAQIGCCTDGSSDRLHYSQRVPTHVDSFILKCVGILCQNCVTYPLKPWGNTAVYGDTSEHIVVAGSRRSEVCWCDFVCVSPRGGNRFPSVLLQPLGHLSALELTICGRPGIGIAQNPPSRISDLICRMPPTIYRDAHDIVRADCVRPSNVVRSLVAILESKRIDQWRQRRRLLSSAGVVEEEARKRRAPILQHADQRTARKVFGDSLLSDPREARPIESRLALRGRFMGRRLRRRYAMRARRRPTIHQKE